MTSDLEAIYVMRTNELVAIILCALVIMLYFGVIYPRYAPKPIPQPQKPIAADTTPSSVSTVTTETAVQPAMVTQPVAIDTVVLAQAKDVRVETDLYTATFTTLGGTLKSWQLKKYQTEFEPLDLLQKELVVAQQKNNLVRVHQIQQRIEETKQYLELNQALQTAEVKKDTTRIAELKQKLAETNQVNLIDTLQAEFAPLEIQLPGFNQLDRTTLYQVTTTYVSLSTTQPESQLVFTATLPNGMTVQKIYQFNHNTYGITCQFKLTNPSDKLVKLNENGDGMRIGLGSGLGKVPIANNKAMTFGLAPFAQTKHAVTNLKLNTKTVKQSLTGEIAWAGLQTHYFLKILVPQVSLVTTITAELDSAHLPNIWVHLPTIDIPGKSTFSFPFLFYLGPKELEYLERAKLPAEQVLFPGFMLAGLDMLVLKTLRFFYKLIPNYGVAIILLSIFFKIITLPLTQMSFKSMKKMQLLAPQMNEIKTKYKDDPRRMHQETMALMKKYRVSYGSGCLPLLIQMPIMFALYTTISRAVELNGAPFILWIKDLSKPDTIFYIAGLPVNILPILMGISMLWQMKMTPNPDKQQQKMMMVMNIFFIFLFWGLQSGLVLYWFITNILSIIHQYYINKQPIKLEPVVQKSKYSRWQEMKKKYEKRK
ncbi:MAG: membrane protein insertase YidC [bacterium]|nr:membrane protein insertase YidC [bacterium]